MGILVLKSSHRNADPPCPAGNAGPSIPWGCWSRGASHPSPGRVGCWEAASGRPLSKPRAQPCAQPAWDVPRSVFLSFQQPRCVPVSLSVVCLCLVCGTGDTPCLNHVSVMSSWSLSLPTTFPALHAIHSRSSQGSASLQTPSMPSLPCLPASLSSRCSPPGTPPTVLSLELSPCLCLVSRRSFPMDLSQEDGIGWGFGSLGCWECPVLRFSPRK